MLDKIIKLIFPENLSCYGCGKDVFDSPCTLCKDCLKNLPYLMGDLCLHCGEPLVSSGNYCKRCKGRKFFYDRAVAPFIYRDLPKNLIYGLKYNNKKYYSKCLAYFMAQRFKDCGLNAHYIIPVPLCEKRLKQRGYNQSKILADEISKILNIKVKDQILFRIKETPTQTNLNYEERQKNLKDAFKVKNAKQIKDKFVILVDDVFTTGATITECAKALKKAGAKVIYALTAAHTILNEPNI